MISAQQAHQFILRCVSELSAVVSVEDAWGRMLRKDVRASRPLPPFDRVTMDGVAIRLASLEKGLRRFLIEGVQAAGQSLKRLRNSSACLEVMTGAVLPRGCDCVIPVEVFRKDGSYVVLPQGYQARRFQYIHPRGSDVRVSDVILKKGTRLLTPQIGAVISAGLSRVFAAKVPSVGLVSTGDELVRAGRRAKTHEIYLSNIPAIAAKLTAEGYSDIRRAHCPDQKTAIRRTIRQFLSVCDVVVISGGISAGKFDYVPDVLKELKVKEIFYKVRQHPGKPLWFGVGLKRQLVFALPGNPVSSLVCFYHYVLPALRRMASLDESLGEDALMEQSFSLSNESVTHFVPVSARTDRGKRVLIRPLFLNTSGDFATLSKSDGFIEIPEKTVRVARGAVFRLIRW